MLLAIPILIAVSIFLGWGLVKLTIHAFPLFVGVATLSFMLHAGASIGTALIGAVVVALFIVAGGRSLAARSPSAAVRAGIFTAFAAPASFAAYHAVMGLTAMLLGSDAWRTTWALVAALIVGAAAWREVAMCGDRKLAR